MNKKACVSSLDSFLLHEIIDYFWQYKYYGYKHFNDKRPFIKNYLHGWRKKS